MPAPVADTHKAQTTSRSTRAFVSFILCGYWMILAEVVDAGAAPTGRALMGGGLNSERAVRAGTPCGPSQEEGIALTSSPKNSSKFLSISRSVSVESTKERPKPTFGMR